MQQIVDSGDERVGVDRLRRERLPAREGKQARGQGAGPLDALQRHVLRPFDPVPAAALRQMDELSVDGVETAEHQGQQVVEVVSDAAGELAERLHLLRLAQLFLEAAPSLTSRALTTTRRGSPVAGRNRGRDGFDDAAFAAARS